MAARGLVNGARDEVVGGMKSELVPTNQAKLTLPPLSSYIKKKGDDLISHPLLYMDNQLLLLIYALIVSLWTCLAAEWALLCSWLRTCLCSLCHILRSCVPSCLEICIVLVDV